MKLKVLFLAAAVAAFPFVYSVAAPEYRLHAAMQRATTPNPEHPSIVMLGDSHTEFVNWRALLSCGGVANAGVGGNTTAQMVERLPQVLAAAPRLVFLMAGTNDALQHVDPEVSRANIHSIAAFLAAHGILVAILPPPPLPSARREIAAITALATVAIPFADGDLLEDHVHLRRSAYAKWRDAIMPLVDKFCRPLPA